MSRLGEQQTAESHTAFFTAGEITDLGIPRRKTKRVSSNFHLRIGVRTAGSDDSFKPSLLGGLRRQNQRRDRHKPHRLC